MIQTKNTIPRVYSDSYDMSVFTGLLDLIYNARDTDIEILKGLHLPNNCSEDNLQGLSSLFNLSTNNRKIIANYRRLIKIKGTQNAIESTAILCGASSIVRTSVDRNEDNPLTTITVTINSQGFDSNLFNTIMERVAPVNALVVIRITPSQS